MLLNTSVHDTPTIGHLSGGHAAYGNMLMLLTPRKFCTILLVWGLTLLC